jgi:hypothetical protein
MRAPLALATAIVVAPATAAADRREASLHAHAIGGLVTLGGPATDDTSSALALGVAARASYATSNRFQYDAQLAVLAGSADWDRGTFDTRGGTVTGPFSRGVQAARLDAGVTLRFGVALIPTVRVALGVQGVRYGAAEVDNGASTVTAAGSDALGLHLIGSASAGLDYRVNRRLIVGAAAGASLAVPGVGEAWRSFDVTLHAAYYYYPRW